VQYVPCRPSFDVRPPCTHEIAHLHSCDELSSERCATCMGKLARSSVDVLRQLQHERCALHVEFRARGRRARALHEREFASHGARQVLHVRAALVHHGVAPGRHQRVLPHHRLAAHLVYVPTPVRDHPAAADRRSACLRWGPAGMQPWATVALAALLNMVDAMLARCCRPPVLRMCSGTVNTAVHARFANAEGVS
jgi:hypothetical protein